MRLTQARTIVPLGLALILGTQPAHADDPPLDAGIGHPVSVPALPDATTGRAVIPADLAGRKAVVLVFLGIECPVGNLYAPRLAELARMYDGRGVAFLGVNANPDERPEAVAAHAREYGIEFPVLLDPDGLVADALKVDRTCTAAVLTPGGGEAAFVLRYRGAIDNQYSYGVRRSRPARPYLAEALDAVLAGQPIETAATTVVGCPIERGGRVPARPLPRIRPAAPEVIEALSAVDPEVDPDTLGAVDFSRNVAPILSAECAGCHRPGQVAPFSLLTYEDARRHADGIAEAVAELRMPPWHADPRYGHFANDRRLSSRDRATLLAWVEQGSLRGENLPKREPVPGPSAPDTGWSIGTPDLVLEIPAPFTVKADGELPYERFTVPTGFTEDKWMQAMEPRPGDRSVVHHIVIYLADGRRQGPKKFDDLEHLAAYAPGDIPTVLPPGVAKRIPAGSEFIFELHYTPNGKVRFDRSSVGLVFAKEPPKYRARTHAVANMGFRIPPGAGRYEVSASEDAPADTLLLGLFPHMHLRGRDFTYTAVYPDERREILLSVPRYDFAWQSYYWLAEPKPLPKGTRIECVAHFDNSTGNPALTEEDTRQEVSWGDQTYEEMMIGYVDLLEPVGPDR